MGPLGRGVTERRPARAETVGILLRPPALRAAIDAFYEPGHSATLAEERDRDRTALTAMEDEAIRAVVQRQIDCGLDVVTDGEFRRWMFMNSFYDAVDGVRTGKTVAFRNDRGEDVRLNIHEIVGPPCAGRLAGRARGGVHGRRDRRISVQGDVPCRRRSSDTR